MKNRSAFTLVELVVVILILGILAGVAAPKLLGTSATATENGLRQTLSVVRNAIELSAAQNGGLPTVSNEADLKAALEDYLRGDDFPVSPVGEKDATIEIASGAGNTSANGNTSWMYNKDDGTFICNETSTDSASDAYSSY